MDRYTVYYLDDTNVNPGFCSYVAMNSKPFHPQGFGQHGEGRFGRHNGKRIPFASLPADCRKLVEQDTRPISAS